MHPYNNTTTTTDTLLHVPRQDYTTTATTDINLPTTTKQCIFVQLLLPQPIETFMQGTNTPQYYCYTATSTATDGNRFVKPLGVGLHVRVRAALLHRSMGKVTVIKIGLHLKVLVRLVLVHPGQLKEQSTRARARARARAWARARTPHRNTGCHTSTPALVPFYCFTTH